MNLFNIFSCLKRKIFNTPQYLVKDIKEFLAPNIEIRNKIKEYLDNNQDWVKNLELFNYFPYKPNLSHVTPIEISFIINLDEFNDLSILNKRRTIYEIIGIDDTRFDYVKLNIDDLNEKRLNLYLYTQTDVYLFCKSFGYIDKLMQVIAEDINSKILTHSPHKNYTSTIFDIRYAYVNSFIEHIKKIFPDCYTLNFTTDSYSIHLGITWGSSFLK